jgi:hypothetical protein
MNVLCAHGRTAVMVIDDVALERIVTESHQLSARLFLR